jgi:hypothetical protein
MFQVGCDLVTNQSVQRYQLSDDGIFEVVQAFSMFKRPSGSLEPCQAIGPYVVAASSGIVRLRFLVWFGIITG